MNRCTLLRTLTASALLLAVALAGCAQRSVVTQASTESVTGRPDIYIWPNSNSHSNNEATLRLVVRAGSLQESDLQLGYAHFVEHMAFNGTEAFPKSVIQERLNELGMSIGSHSNAYTTFDHTAYTLSLNSVDTERLEAALELLAEWAYRIEFDADEVVKERPVILEEWRQSQPQEDRVGEQLFKHYFAGSRYLDRRPIGTPESISEATGESLRAFYQQWYQPDNMAVIVAGDFDEAEVRSLVERYFPTREVSGEPVQPEQYSINLDAIDDRIAVTDPYTTSGYVDLTYYSEAELPQIPEDLVERLSWEAALDIWYNRAQKRLVSTQGVVSDVSYSWEYASPDLFKVILSASLSQDDLKTGLQIIENERQRLLLPKWKPH